MYQCARAATEPCGTVKFDGEKRSVRYKCSRAAEGVFRQSTKADGENENGENEESCDER